MRHRIHLPTSSPMPNRYGPRCPSRREASMHRTLLQWCRNVSSKPGADATNSSLVTRSGRQPYSQNTMVTDMQSSRRFAGNPAPSATLPQRPRPAGCTFREMAIPPAISGLCEPFGDALTGLRLRAKLSADVECWHAKGDVVMSQFRVTFDGADCLVSITDIPDGVSWRARIMRNGCISREVTGVCPDTGSPRSEIPPRVEQEVREAVAWLDGRRTTRPK
jgi:hypothetical protein